MREKNDASDTRTLGLLMYKLDEGSWRIQVAEESSKLVSGKNSSTFDCQNKYIYVFVNF